MMKIFLILLVTSVIVIGGPKEDLLQVRNETHFKLTTERLALVKKDTDLSILHNNILRTHGKLAAALAKHPEMKKNEKLKEPALSKLKLKLIDSDEDLRDLKAVLVQRHRKLEVLMMKNKRIKELTDRVFALDARLAKMK
jgi:hypothetical protein